MCGIAGWLGHGLSAATDASRLAQALKHRGPDSYGIRSWPQAALVHTRLSIIDLSASGAQPMTNEDGTIWTAFNGEIYNHKDLRKQLESRGHVFHGHSDGEILPHLYEEEGVEFVTKLRGMFAIAVYDTRARRLILARDRFGIKPLFYTLGKRRVAFASEIRPLVDLPGTDMTIDRQAIYDFAALCYIPAPATLYAGVRALQPCERLEAQLEGDRISCQVTPYHRWVIAPDLALTLDDAAERADELITAAVERQLESDVSLGSLLSGGIDSSLISVAAQQALEGRLRTFNVRFSDREFDETWAALAVADHIKSVHETLDIGNTGGTWEYITGLLLHAGQPFADSSIFAVNAVSKLMRQRVTVALSGDGGDEGFGGYNYYWWLTEVVRLQRFPKWAWKGAALLATPLASAGLAPASLARRLHDLGRMNDTSIIRNLFAWTRETEQLQLCRDTDVLPVHRLFEQQWEHHLPVNASRLERLSARATEANIRLTLPNDYLFKVDIASMKESLEIRVPMLDEDLFSFVLSLPHELKVQGRTGKRVLRRIAERKLPASVANKPKWGFAMPVDCWVDDHFKSRLMDALSDRSCKLPEFFRPEVYRNFVNAFIDGRTSPHISRQGLYSRVMMLLAVELSLNGAAV
jgi:asparagine synthase (glutamine-hydrolysing)